ncbi:hypothetical protein [Novosphingobium sp. 9U]|uniref:hypothetical protein n=1 Tax=Novosphingobium sp. 9U TaxID=2653158 RepID=UPI0012F1B2A3|nr:hypothetical protein [Novosphingobium sp. 9U]VWX46477.1 exported hypothetical protein [Novosphingobium sp. 9U]
MRRTRYSFVVLAFATIWIKEPAAACVPANYSPTAARAEQNAFEHFHEANSVYEGVLLGWHDYEDGGRLLVLKAYKGPAAPFDVVSLPGGSSCYKEVAPFSAGVWGQSLAVDTFDGFEEQRTVDIWKKHGFVESGALTPIRQFYSVIAMAVSALVIVLHSLVKKGG